jgi:hypothetical protein
MGNSVVTATTADIAACRRKASFGSHDQAMNVVIHQWMEGTHGLHVYACPACGLWHIGHVQPSVTRRIHDQGSLE